MAKKQAEAVYKIVEVVGVSETSWEEAGRNAVETAAGSLRGLAGWRYGPASPLGGSVAGTNPKVERVVRRHQHRRHRALRSCRRPAALATRHTM